jgi:hypothetical protein
MPGIDFTHTGEIPIKPLKDVGVPLVGGSVSGSVEPAIGNVTFKLSAEADASIEVFNQKSDKDQDNVLGKMPLAEEDDIFGKISFPPQVELTDTDAWIKYRFRAQANASVGLKVPPISGISIGAKLDSSIKAIFADYRFHGRDENTPLAVAGDVVDKPVRLAAVKSDILGLRANEALSYQVRGELSASVTLSWSDVFSSGLSSLGGILGPNKLFILKAAPSASVSFHVGLVDDFQVVFTKGTAGRTRIAVKKTKAREIGLTAELNVGVTFLDEEPTKEVLNGLFESTFGVPIAQLEAILAKATFEDLTPQQTKIKDQIIERLGLGPIFATLEDLKKKIAEVKEKVKDTIEAIAKAKVTAGFKYEYLRVKTDDTLMVIQIDQNTLNTVHGDLMLLDLISLRDFAIANPNALERYLNQKSVVRTQAWGFTLGVFGFKFFGKDKKEFTTVVQSDIEDKNFRLAKKGLRSYEDSFGSDSSWLIDYKAEMKGFSPAPKTVDFEHGFHLKTLTTKTIKDENLRELLDTAIIWQIITEEDLENIVTQLRSDGNLGKKGTVGVEMTLDHETLATVLSGINNVGVLGSKSKSLALAMPFHNSFADIRSTLHRREGYTPVWRWYLENPNLTRADYSRAARQILENPELHLEKPGQLIKQEELAEKGVPLGYQHTFTGQVRLLGNDGGINLDGNLVNVSNNFNKYVEGLRTWNTAINTPGLSHDTIDAIFKKIQPLGSQLLYVRAGGVFLMDLASAAPGSPGSINRSCSIAIKDGETYTFGKTS